MVPHLFVDTPQERIDRDGGIALGRERRGVMETGRPDRLSRQLALGLQPLQFAEMPENSYDSRRAHLIGRIVPRFRYWQEEISTAEDDRSLFRRHLEKGEGSIIFDPVNLLDPDNLDRRDEVIASAIELLGPDIAMIHLKDYVMEDGKMKAVGCGLGEMDYTRILKFAKERKPYIHATLENTRPDNAAFCRNHILNIYNNL